MTVECYGDYNKYWSLSWHAIKRNPTNLTLAIPFSITQHNPASCRQMHFGLPWCPVRIHIAATNSKNARNAHTERMSELYSFAYRLLWLLQTYLTFESLLYSLSLSLSRSFVHSLSLLFIHTIVLCERVIHRPVLSLNLPTNRMVRPPPLPSMLVRIDRLVYIAEEEE